MVSFVAQCRRCTDNYKRQLGAWSIQEQIAHVHSEVSEVYQAIKHGESRDRVLEEICDSILSSITMANIAEFSDYELITGLIKTLRKVQKRAGVLQ